MDLQELTVQRGKRKNKRDYKSQEMRTQHREKS